MNRTKKKAPAKAKRKVPERLIPIVDAVVEMVFARLTEGAARAKAMRAKKSSSRSKDATTHAAMDEHHDGLAGAVADLLLASLTHPPKIGKRGKKPAEKRRGPI